MPFIPYSDVQTQPSYQPKQSRFTPYQGQPQGQPQGDLSRLITGEPKPDTSLMAGGKSFLKGLIPSTTALAGGAVGAGIGTALFPGVGTVAGYGIGLAGGLLGAIFGGMGGNWAQNKAIQKVMGDDWTNQMLQNEAKNRETHPISTFTGELASMLPTMGFRPSAIKEGWNAGRAFLKAGEGLTETEAQLARKAFLTNPKNKEDLMQLLNVAVGSGTQAGMEGYQQIQEGKINPIRLAMATIAGATLNEPTGLGKRINSMIGIKSHADVSEAIGSKGDTPKTPVPEEKLTGNIIEPEPAKPILTSPEATSQQETASQQPIQTETTIPKTEPIQPIPEQPAQGIDLGKGYIDRTVLQEGLDAGLTQEQARAKARVTDPAIIERMTQQQDVIEKNKDFIEKNNGQVPDEVLDEIAKGKPHIVDETGKPIYIPKDNGENGIIDRWGTRNQYYVNNPYKKDLDLMKKTKIFDQDIISASSRWEMEQVLKDKPAYLTDNNLLDKEITTFARKNNLKIGRLPDGDIVIAKNNELLQKVLNYKNQRELGIALGMQDIWKPIMKEGKLPPYLAGAKSRWNNGTKTFLPKFESDIDHALYITSQKIPSKNDLAYRDFLKQNGFTDKQIDIGGQKIREYIKSETRNLEGGTQKDPEIIKISKQLIDIIPESQVKNAIPENKQQPVRESVGQNIQQETGADVLRNKRIQGQEETATQEKASVGNIEVKNEEQTKISGKKTYLNSLEGKHNEQGKFVWTESKPSVGVRIGRVPEGGKSYNTREQKYEDGVSLISAGNLPVKRSFAISNLKDRNANLVYVKGDVITKLGGDDEFIMRNAREITRQEYEKELGLPSQHEADYVLSGYKWDLTGRTGGDISKWKQANKEAESKILKLPSPEPVVPAKETGKINKSNWRETFDNTTDVFRKGDILRVVADVSRSNKELDDILIRAKGLPQENNIIYDVEHARKSDRLKQDVSQQSTELSLAEKVDKGKPIYVPSEASVVELTDKKGNKMVIDASDIGSGKGADIVDVKFGNRGVSKDNKGKFIPLENYQDIQYKPVPDSLLKEAGIKSQEHLKKAYLKNDKLKKNNETPEEFLKRAYCKGM